MRYKIDKNDPIFNQDKMAVEKLKESIIYIVLTSKSATLFDIFQIIKYADRFCYKEYKKGLFTNHKLIPKKSRRLIKHLIIKNRIEGLFINESFVETFRYVNKEILNKLDMKCLDIAINSYKLNAYINKSGKIKYKKLKIKMTKPITSNQHIYNLCNPKYRLKQPILITIEEYVEDEETFAIFPELEVFGVDSVEPIAILRLKRAIVDLYEDLTNMPKDTLGMFPLSWLETLQILIEKRK